MKDKAVTPIPSILEASSSSSKLFFFSFMLDCSFWKIDGQQFLDVLNFIS